MKFLSLLLMIITAQAFATGNWDRPYNFDYTGKFFKGEDQLDNCLAHMQSTVERMEKNKKAKIVVLDYTCVPTSSFNKGYFVKINYQAKFGKDFRKMEFNFPESVDCNDELATLSTNLESAGYFVLEGFCQKSSREKIIKLAVSNIGPRHFDNLKGAPVYTTAKACGNFTKNFEKQLLKTKGLYPVRLSCTKSKDWKSKKEYFWSKVQFATEMGVKVYQLRGKVVPSTQCGKLDAKLVKAFAKHKLSLFSNYCLNHKDGSRFEVLLYTDTLYKKLKTHKGLLHNEKTVCLDRMKKPLKVLPTQNKVILYNYCERVEIGGVWDPRKKEIKYRPTIHYIQLPKKLPPKKDPPKK